MEEESSNNQEDGRNSCATKLDYRFEGTRKYGFQGTESLEHASTLFFYEEPGERSKTLFCFFSGHQSTLTTQSLNELSIRIKIQPPQRLQDFSCMQQIWPRSRLRVDS